MTYNVWLSEKPEFTEDVIVILAHKIGMRYEYSSYEVVWYSPDFDSCYWAWLTLDGDEYGDIEDMQADKYMIIKPISK